MKNQCVWKLCLCLRGNIELFKLRKGELKCSFIISVSIIETRKRVFTSIELSIVIMSLSPFTGSFNFKETKKGCSLFMISAAVLPLQSLYRFDFAIFASCSVIDPKEREFFITINFIVPKPGSLPEINLKKREDEGCDLKYEEKNYPPARFIKSIISESFELSSSSGVPSKWILPSCIIATLSATFFTLYKSWVTTTDVTLSF